MEYAARREERRRAEASMVTEYLDTIDRAVKTMGRKKLALLKTRVELADQQCIERYRNRTEVHIADYPNSAMERLVDRRVTTAGVAKFVRTLR